METEVATVLDRVAAAGVLPVVELPSPELGAPLVEALLAGGIDAIEITLRTDAAVEAIAALGPAYADALVGAGTVRTVEDAERVLEAGARFVVSPGLNLDVVEVCRRAGVGVFPGVCTPTEVDAAARAGCDVVKFFPAEAMGGVTFLRALAGPFRDMRFIPTGGIDAVNLASYIRLPQVVACGGSWLVRPALVAAGEFGRVEELAREARRLVAEARGE